MLKKIIKKLIFIFILASTNNVVLANQRFVDVPYDHFAHNAIINISDLGIMVGNTQGQFRPDALLDKFETSRILANMTGFRSIGLTPAEQAFINFAYGNNSDFLEEMNERFDRWSNISNREIAYLLQLGVLTEENVTNFILVNMDNEYLRALSRQEAAMFLVRAIGLSGEASAGIFSNLFADDTDILPQFRHYVYFLRNIGVVTANENGNFMPNAPVTRADFATMIDRAINYNVDNNIINATRSTILLGEIVSINSINRNLTISLQNENAQESYAVSTNANIVVDGLISNFTGLEHNMQIAALLYNDEIVALLGISRGFRELLNQNVGQPLNFQNSINGFVSHISDEEIIIETRTISTTYSIQTNNLSFELSENTTVTMNNSSIPIEDIIIGDIVTVAISRGVVEQIDVLQRNRAFTGTLVSRNEISDFDIFTYTIVDEYENYHEFLVTDSTRLERAGSGVVNFENVRLGDVVEIVAQANELTSLFAFGNRTFVDGNVISVNFAYDISSVVLQKQNENVTYYIIGSLPNMQNITVGSRIRLTVDSLEIQEFSIFPN
ncbi:MAG: S-layer homology domain-containing protein [Defluviitaleaceae bacterium]|nr:S-layer homology domain-containing protein [Defluviitaleaceae bacterium]